MTKRIYILIMLTLSLITIMLFQNCSQNSFQPLPKNAIDLSSASNELGEDENVIMDFNGINNEPLDDEQLSSPLSTNVSDRKTYYVATTGSDINTCEQARTTSKPKKTIRAGVKCLASGDTLIIKAGTYAGPIYNPAPGSSSAYTIIKGDPSGPRPVIDPQGELGYTKQEAYGFLCTGGSKCSYIELRHLEIKTAFISVKMYGQDTTGYPHHVRFINNIFHDTIGTNVVISTSKTGYIGGDHLFQGNLFYRTGVGNPGYAPGHNTIYNPGNRTIVERNTFRNLANGVGIWSSGMRSQNVTVRNNIFYDIGRSSIDTWQIGNGGFSAVHINVPGGGHKIYNNIVYRSGDQASFAAFKIGNVSKVPGSPSEVNYVYNNTIYDLRNSAASAVRVAADAVGTQYIRNNIAYLAGKITGGVQSNNLFSNPLFTNAAGGVFTLKIGSPAIDKGVKNTISVIDFRGIARPRGAGFDIGAYEY